MFILDTACKMTYLKCSLYYNPDQDNPNSMSLNSSYAERTHFYLLNTGNA